MPHSGQGMSSPAYRVHSHALIGTFFDGNQNDKVSVIADYINFCISTCIPVKTVRKYPNSKPWITPQIKHCLKEKHKAFREKNWVNLKLANCNIKNEVLRAKLKYKDRLENEFSNINTMQVFQKVRTLTGCKFRNTSCANSAIDPALFVKEPNALYASFDNQDFSTECEKQFPPPDPDNPSPFNAEYVRCQLSRCKLGKAPGPDGISAQVLKNCAQELSPIFHLIFCEAYFTATIPSIWKMSIIIPVPKKPRPMELNHYRPVALTFIIMKCLEKLLLNTILPAVYNWTPSNLPIRLKGVQRML